MRLSKLSISGFKSFAKATALEFPVEVSAVVGPNGSGKSNITEAIRWVLGEQSMKSLRGRKGEDLIFNGSPNAARMGKASVGLIFDNRDHAIHSVDFDEVVLERKIFRDGANEYYLNGSQVRLKDIVELLARMGLGETKHNIISQGEVDRLLISSPRERRELLEEAIGLRLYQLRQREAERKLAETGENIRQVESLIREISPHLKFLKTQADKAEKREAARAELDYHARAYAAKENAAINAESERLERETGPARAKLQSVDREIKEIGGEFEAGASGDGAGSERTRALENEIGALENRRRELERELGRIEGRLGAGGQKMKPHRVELNAVESGLAPIVNSLRAAADLGAIEEIKRRVKEALAAAEEMIANLRRASGAAPDASNEDPGLANEQERVQKELLSLEDKIAKIRGAVGVEIDSARRIQAGLRERWQRLREREEEAGRIRARLQEFIFEKEKLAMRRSELERIIEDSGVSAGQFAGDIPDIQDLELPDLKKKIERLKARLEEIGGIDPAVLKEYEDTKSRHNFLSGEIRDLAGAAQDLEALSADLGKRIERDFEAGFAKIKAEFHHYFRIIFGGGRGVLEYTALRKPKSADDSADDEKETESEYGVTISVDIPRKRIKGLDMLSGGERALTSIALLFAITAVNPPPFLILDETDAALDEANSQKYAAILKELSKKTQLILVTHNRETMKQAGVLYGVTMGEDGVSKLLSLKLEEATSYGNR